MLHFLTTLSGPHMNGCGSEASGFGIYDLYIVDVRTSSRDEPCSLLRSMFFILLSLLIEGSSNTFPVPNKVSKIFLYYRFP